MHVNIPFCKICGAPIYDEEIEKERKALKKAESGVLYQLSGLKDIHGKIFDVVNWFLAQSSDDIPITHLALQKLLYFTQSWSSVLLEEEIFSNECQAWVHGAVYPEVYDIFKKFKYMPLPKLNYTARFNEDESMILDAVKKYYFDIYSAKALEEICHREFPYKEARQGYTEDETCHITIDKKSIVLYYKQVAQKYNINLSDLSNIKEYLNIMIYKLKMKSNTFPLDIFYIKAQNRVIENGFST